MAGIALVSMVAKVMKAKSRVNRGVDSTKKVVHWGNMHHQVLLKGLMCVCSGNPDADSL